MRNLFHKLGLLRKQFVSCLKMAGLENAVVVKRNEDVFKPPEAVRGMKVLDRDAFTKSIKLPAMLVPSRSLQRFCKLFKKDRLTSRYASTTPSPEDKRYVAMVPEFDLEKVDHLKMEELKELNVEQKLHEITMDIRYEHYKHFEILAAIMPNGVTPNSGFERVGHIVHVNLLEEQKPFKRVIGQVILDTQKTARTVVDKACTIDNTYRNFKMDVIAGEEDFITTVIEHGRRFQFDYSKVFWNSRLETEHMRIIDLITKGSIVFDVFAGVGPFSIPLAKKGCQVYANDLNSESYKWLCHNAKLNKTQLNAFNLDGREFIESELSKFVRTAPKESKIFVIMNLPGHAVDFLDAFPGLLSTEITNREDNEMPDINIFCYTFSAAEDKILDVETRAAERLGQNLPELHKVRDVRKVSPNKDQFCLSFVMPEDILMQPKSLGRTDDLEPQAKKPRLSTDD